MKEYRFWEISDYVLKNKDIEKQLIEFGLIIARITAEDSQIIQQELENLRKAFDESNLKL